MNRQAIKILSLALVLATSSSVAFAQKVWKGTWATAVEWTGKGDMPKESLSNRSCRQIVHVSFGGEELRVKLSNEQSKEPVEIKSVYIADTDVPSNWGINAKTVKYLKFNGKKNVTIAPGKAIFSDDLKYALKSGQRLTITIDYGKQTPVNATSHRGSRTTSYIVSNVKGKAVKPADAAFDKQEKADHWYNLSAIDVKTDKATPVVAILGNSITDGRGSTTNHQNRWTDFLSDALNAEKPYGVLNLGIGGNCVVQGGLSEPAMKRFDRDILGQAGVDKLIIFEGTNDIGCCGGNYEHVTDTLIACYKVLEQKIAGVLVANIQNIKTFKADENTDASTIPIPIYDVYYALLNNSVIDIDHFTAADASETEQKIAAALERKQEEIFQKVDEQLTGSDTKPYKDLSEEMKGYVSYIVNDLLMDKTGILSETSIDKNDEMYKAWTKDETISLQEYLTYAASQNWIDISKFSDKNTYLDSTEVYQELSAYISDYLSTDQDFSKMLYKYLLLDDEITGKQLCTVLYEQGVLSTDDEDYQNFKAGNLSAMDLMLHKISSLEITPAQLALDPCSGSVVITDPSTGETLACVSYPGYDNNRLANNMDTDYYRKLNKDLSTPFIIRRHRNVRHQVLHLNR